MTCGQMDWLTSCAVPEGHLSWIWGVTGALWPSSSTSTVPGCCTGSSRRRTRSRWPAAGLRTCTCNRSFEIGDLTQGAACFKPFGEGGYDIMLLVGVYHKIKRPPSKPYADLGAKAMSAEALSEFMTFIGRRTLRYLGARVGLEDIPQLESDFGKAGLRLIMTSGISELGPTAIWRRD